MHAADKTGRAASAGPNDTRFVSYIGAGTTCVYAPCVGKLLKLSLLEMQIGQFPELFQKFSYVRILDGLGLNNHLHR